MTASLAIAHTDSDPRLIADLAARLHGDLQARLAATTNPAVRLQRTLAWWLRAVCIEALTGIAPGRQRFASEDHGRPRLVGQPTLHIGLSHTRGLAACALSLRGALGVDVEPLDRQARWQRLDSRLFTASERAALRVLPPGEQGAQRIRLWTLKEACAKADGRGVSMGLGSIECRPAEGAWALRAPGGPAAARAGQRDIDATWSLAWVLSRPEDLRMTRIDPASGAVRPLSGVV